MGTVAQAEVETLARRVVYSQAGEYAAFPNIGRDTAGLYIEFSVRETNSHFEKPSGPPLTFRSLDEGDHWVGSSIRSRPDAFSCGKDCISIPSVAGWREKKAVTELAEGGNARIFKANGKDYVSNRVRVKLSSDGGRTWTEEQLDTEALSFVMNYNSSAYVKLQSGVKMVAVYGRRLDSHKTEPFILRSSDGRSWRMEPMFSEGALSQVAGLNETALLSLGGTRVLAVSRADPDGTGLYSAVSEDNGSSWSKPRPLGIRGYPANLVDSPKGIILTYGYRLAPMGIRMAVLNRKSLDITESAILIDDAKGRPSDVGYPVTISLGNLNFITTYYTTDYSGVTHIESLKWRFKE